jgi:hypothetical protein
VATTKDDTTQTAVAPKPTVQAVKPFPKTDAGITRAEGISASPQSEALIHQYAPQLSKLLGVDIKPTSAAIATPPEPYIMSPGVAGFEQGNATYYKPDYQDAHTVVHELAHSFTLGDYSISGSHVTGPSWLVEGLAEWAAEKIAPKTPDPNLGQRFGVVGEDPTTGYGPSAGFIEWLDKTQPGAVKLMAAALNDGYYSDKWFSNHFGGSPAAMMEQYDPSFEGAGSIKGTPAKFAGDIRGWDAVLSGQFNLSPLAERAARTVAAYQAAVWENHNVSGDELRYSFGDYTFDVVDAIHRGDQYLDDLEARTMRMTSGNS